MFVISILSEKPLAEHALLRTIGTGTADPWTLRGIHANSRAFAGAIPTWMKVLIDRAPDPEIQILLVRQLHEELGRDDLNLRHGVRPDWLLLALEAMAYRIGADHRRPAPGRCFLEDSGQCFRDPSSAASVGALVAAKYRSEELSTWLDIVLRRQDKVPVSQFDWLERQANRQAEHAADIENLLVITASDCERSEAIGGARSFDAHLWKFLDVTLQRRCERWPLRPCRQSGPELAFANGAGGLA